MTKRLGIVVHQHREAVVELARRAQAWCEAKGFEISMPPSDAALLDCMEIAVSESEFGPGLDACISIGGDGTMLRTVDLVAPHGVAVLGINAGTLGYLAEIDPSTSRRHSSRGITASLGARIV